MTVVDLEEVIVSYLMSCCSKFLQVHFSVGISAEVGIVFVVALLDTSAVIHVVSSSSHCWVETPKMMRIFQLIIRLLHQNSQYHQVEPF